MNVERFLEHHGVKGMQWETTRQQTLDRIYRVAAGTASRKEKQKEMLKLLTKDIMKDDEKTNRSNPSEIATKLLLDFGATPINDLVSPD